MVPTWQLSWRIWGKKNPWFGCFVKEKLKKGKINCVVRKCLLPARNIEWVCSVWAGTRTMVSGPEFPPPLGITNQWGPISARFSVLESCFTQEAIWSADTEQRAMTLICAFLFKFFCGRNSKTDLQGTTTKSKFELNPRFNCKPGSYHAHWFLFLPNPRPICHSKCTNERIRNYM